MTKTMHESYAESQDRAVRAHAAHVLADPSSPADHVDGAKRVLASPPWSTDARLDEMTAMSVAALGDTAAVDVFFYLIDPSADPAIRAEILAVAARHSNLPDWTQDLLSPAK